jgi:hypothetical protein
MRYFRLMLSKIIKEKVEQRFGNQLRYSKQCDALALHVSKECRTSVSASTLRRLLGFVKGTGEPRLYTLDIIAMYIGHKDWEHLLASFEKGEPEKEISLEKLSPHQIKSGQGIKITYQPGKIIELKKIGQSFQVVNSNEKKLILNDEIKFHTLELHYPVTFTNLFREGNSMGRLQLATVSGVTSIRKV